MGQWCQGANQQCYVQLPPIECAINLVPFPFNNSGKETSCEEVAGYTLKKKTNKCKNETIAENCPGLCNKDKCPCANSPFPFPFNRAGEETSCEEVARSTLKKKTNKCKNEKIAENFPDLCNKGKCPCANSPFPFPFNRAGKETSCEELAALPEKQKNNKCKNKSRDENCPGICGKDQCPI
jgi:hypothetical protein